MFPVLCDTDPALYSFFSVCVAFVHSTLFGLAGWLAHLGSITGSRSSNRRHIRALLHLQLRLLLSPSDNWMPSRVPHTHSGTLFLSLSPGVLSLLLLLLSPRLDALDSLLFSCLSLSAASFILSLSPSFCLSFIIRSVCAVQKMYVCAYTRARNGTKVAPMAVAAVFMSYAAHLRWHRAAFSRLKGASNPLFSLSVPVFENRCESIWQY